MDGNSEFIVSIMSSVAQKESEDINQNVTWGHRKRFADGKILMSYKSFLGYEKGQDGEPKIVEEEAAIVRQIYALFLEGKTYHQIAKTLMSNEILTPKKQKNWSVTTVQSILKNEKYAGNALLQKNFTVDFLSKTIKKNEGEVPQYFVENSHPAIIPQETFDLTQSEIARRAKMGGKFGGCGRLFSGKIICGRCGAFYGSKVWRDHKGNEKTVWQCKNRTKNGKCNAPYLSKDQIKQAYVRAYNEILGDKNRYLQELEDICTELSNLQKLDIEIFNSRQELEIVAELIRKAIEENARIALDQGDYRQHYSALRKRFEIKKTRQDELLAQRAERIAKRAKTHKFLEDLRNQDNRIADFDEHSWNVLVETAVYHDEEKFTVKFRDGRETRVC
jgi:hypothetical protein